jgi:two-component system OmpR family response regulator
MDLLAHTVRRGAEPLDLQPREFRLLEYLMRHLDQVVTRGVNESSARWD